MDQSLVVPIIELPAVQSDKDLEYGFGMDMIPTWQERFQTFPQGELLDEVMGEKLKAEFERSCPFYLILESYFF